MKKILIFSLLFILTLITQSCFETETYSVSGTINYLGETVEGATVSIDNMFNWTTETDAEGQYTIQSVTKGRHDLTAKLDGENQSYSMVENTIQVNSDLQLNEIRLPKTVHMVSVELGAENAINIKWFSSDASDFREYKIYRHETSGLDETTGTLVHVTTERSDTTFTDDDTSPNITYFYRVFTMNDFGKLGGSNILSAKTGLYNMIRNGDFEIIDFASGFPLPWFVWNNDPHVRLDSSEVYHGNYSMLIERTDSMVTSYDLIQELNLDQMVDGQRYKLSYWIKHTEMTGNQPTMDILIAHAPIESTNWYYFYPVYRAPQSATEWGYEECTFTYSKDNGAANIFFQLSVAGYPAYNVWIDSVAIIQFDE